MIQSPLNYTGGKFRLLSQILPLFPKDIGTFVDLFCGGCNVGINVPAQRHIYNDLEPHLISIYNTFKILNKDDIFETISQIIEKYGLSKVCIHGYDYYGCESGKGLGSYNKQQFNRLKEDYNSYKTDEPYYDIMLYVLIVYAFNNQIRFNGSGEYNLPVGKRDFNEKMQEKLSAFIDVIKSQNNLFLCQDFRTFKDFPMSSKDFVYADPPYLITCATYNEKMGWTEKDERDLLSLLDGLTENGIRFALSNVLRSKGKENKILIGWTEKNKEKYRVIPLKYNYANSNYHTKDKEKTAEEVLIVNY